MDFSALPSYSKFFEKVDSPKPGMDLKPGDKVSVKIANSPAFPGKIEVGSPHTALASTPSLCFVLSVHSARPEPSHVSITSLRAQRTSTHPVLHRLTPPRLTLPNALLGLAVSLLYSLAPTPSTGRPHKLHQAERRSHRRRSSQACSGDCSMATERLPRAPG